MEGLHSCGPVDTEFSLLETVPTFGYLAGIFQTGDTVEDRVYLISKVKYNISHIYLWPRSGTMEQLLLVNFLVGGASGTGSLYSVHLLFHSIAECGQ